MFGGAWFRLDEVGGPVKTVAGYLPFSHAVDAMRAIMEDGAAFADVAGDLAWVAVFTLGAVVLAVGSIRKRMLE